MSHRHEENGLTLLSAQMHSAPRAPARSVCKISIIIPTLNEARLIRPLLLHLRERAPGAEIVVADGGSEDGTADLAAGFCDRLVESGRSRATQMNAGAH